MDETNLARMISDKVVVDLRLGIAVIGIIGVVSGALVTQLGNIFFHWIKEKPQRDLDNKRISILIEMLDDDRFVKKWRNISTMSAVIGANAEETKRLLIKAKARGSEIADEQWGLIKNHPFLFKQ